MAYFPPPIPDDFPNPEILKNMTPEDLKEFRNSKAYEKYVVPAIERDNQLKKEQRIDWFWGQRFTDHQHNICWNFHYLCNNIAAKITSINIKVRTETNSRNTCVFRNFLILSLECVSIPAV